MQQTALRMLINGKPPNITIASKQDFFESGIVWSLVSTPFQAQLQRAASHNDKIPRNLEPIISIQRNITPLTNITNIKSQTLVMKEQMKGKNSFIQQENSDEIQSEHPLQTFFKPFQIL